MQVAGRVQAWMDDAALSVRDQGGDECPMDLAPGMGTNRKRSEEQPKAVDQAQLEMLIPLS